VAVEELGLDSVYEELQIYSVIISLVISFSIVSYSQFDLFLAYVAGWLYTLLRSYFFFAGAMGGSNSTYYWIRLNSFIFLALMVSYMFSRTYHQREREQFMEKKS
jgi:hypothetical protein